MSSCWLSTQGGPFWSLSSKTKASWNGTNYVDLPEASSSGAFASEPSMKGYGSVTSPSCFSEYGSLKICRLPPDGTSLISYSLPLQFSSAWCWQAGWSTSRWSTARTQQPSRRSISSFWEKTATSLTKSHCGTSANFCSASSWQSAKSRLRSWR